MHYCPKCQSTVPKERIEALIEFKPIDQITCLECSTEQKNYVVMVFGHKTAGEAVSINSHNSENVRQAERFNRRAR